MFAISAIVFVGNLRTSQDRRQDARQAADQVETATVEAEAVVEQLRTRLDAIQAERAETTGTKPTAKPIILEGPLTEIVDGDTVTLRMGNHEYRIRLHGIDCPELDQPFGDQAAGTLAAIVDSDEVEYRLTDADRYGRLVGVLSLDGKSINQELVEAGLAWWYQKYAPDDQGLAEAQEAAKAANRGLWAEGEAVAPWEWRKER